MEMSEQACQGRIEGVGHHLQKVCAWLHVLPLHQYHIYTDISPASLEQFLRAIWGAVSQAVVLILLQIKFNSQVSLCAFFFFFFKPALYLLSETSSMPLDPLGPVTNEPVFSSSLMIVDKVLLGIVNKKIN